MSKLTINDMNASSTLDRHEMAAISGGFSVLEGVVGWALGKILDKATDGPSIMESVGKAVMSQGEHK